MSKRQDNFLKTTKVQLHEKIYKNLIYIFPIIMFIFIVYKINFLFNI